VITNYGWPFAQLLQKALGDFSRHGSAERTYFTAGQNSLRPRVHSRIHVLGQDIVTQFKNDVGVGLVAGQCES